MFVLQPVHTIVLLAAIFVIGKCYTYPMILQRQEAQMQECNGCGNECDKCTFGVTVSSFCGVNECRKGPGERCGGPSQSLGVCGAGLSCTCGLCTGCSLDVYSHPCIPNTCPPYQTWEQRNHHEMNGGVYLDIHGNIRPPDGGKIRRIDERRVRGLNME
ncbi:PREDICTED: uncharacterized protein LOC106750834 [Dinoponera quadriceps]|uniref:Uncharacterized protein LOC106750834 n=1 Tax=Dinoponera quadriceps TaxID=609295 RepID=A0A6P3Y989_DINQU|nr:PREDICTED: uncharacterized protein LOC106750834 [Dinoponera quadriceps]